MKKYLIGVVALLALGACGNEGGTTGPTREDVTETQTPAEPTPAPIEDVVAPEEPAVPEATVETPTAMTIEEETKLIESFKETCQDVVIENGVLTATCHNGKAGAYSKQITSSIEIASCTKGIINSFGTLACAE